MNQIKKSASLVLAVLLVFSLAACGSSAPAPVPQVTAAPTDVSAAPVQDSSAAVQDNGSGELLITSGGRYHLSGSYSDQMLVIDAGKSDVTLTLDGVDIRNSNGPALFIRSAGEVTLLLAEGSENTLSDGNGYSIIDSDSELNACVFSKADLRLDGRGTLNVYGNMQHGIVSKDSLSIINGNYHIEAQKCALDGKDYLEVLGGTLDIIAGSDGMRASHKKDLERGYIRIAGGDITIAADRDGLQANSDIRISGGTLSVTTGSGSAERPVTSDSYKALKAERDIHITGGTFLLDAMEDGLHSNRSTTIEGGDFLIRAANDGIHANAGFTLTGGTVSVAQSYEGVEAYHIIISSGELSVVSVNDGLNCSGKDEVGKAAGFDAIGAELSGGTVRISAEGDGFDSNGSLFISGGELFINGSTDIQYVPIEWIGSGRISGGLILAADSGEPLEAIPEMSGQFFLYVSLEGKAGETITVSDAAGSVIAELTAERDFSHVFVSAPEIVSGGSYVISTSGGASCSAENITCSYNTVF